jgi:hypothetical protein
MATIVVPIGDIVIDPENPVDLTKLSEAEAIEEILPVCRNGRDGCAQGWGGHYHPV